MPSGKPLVDEIYESNDEENINQSLSSPPASTQSLGSG